MKSFRLYLMVAWITLALFGVFLAVRAQEGPLFAPPPLLVSEEAEKKAPAKVPFQTQPLRDRKKADASQIIPAEVYDLPRPLGAPVEARRGYVTEEGPGTIQAQGVAAPPLPGLEPTGDKGPNPLPPLPALEAKPPLPALEAKPSLPALEAKPPLPALEAKPPLPLPMIDPTRVLITEPTGNEGLPKKTPKVELPASPKKASIVELPPPAILMPSPLVIPDTKSAPPTVSLPSALPEPAPSEKPGAFVRIKSAAGTAPLTVPPLDLSGLEQQRLDLDKKFPLPQPIVSVGAGQSGLANLQTPSVTVEKRGPANLRREQSAEYQIVVRNLGPGLAQQVRIEDELPANARIMTADPMPAVQGNKAVWLLAALGANQVKVLRITVQATADADITGRLNAQVAASSQTIISSLGPRNDLVPMTIQVTGPEQIAVGKSTVILVHVRNQSDKPLTDLVLHGKLPDGLVVRVKDETGAAYDEREIRGDVEEIIAPGESKTLKMPAHAVKAGRWTVAVKVTTKAGHEASATVNVDVAAETLHLQQPSATRLYMGRDGDLRIDVTNNTTKPMRNVTIADRLPDGFDFVDANSRGLYQANSRIVYWVLDQLPAGKTQTLVVRVNGGKAGQHQNVVFAKADGVPEMQSAGIVTLEGLADLTMRVTERDNPLELGKETVYEIKVQNTGNLPAGNVQLQVQFPPGLTPKNAQGKTRFSVDRQSIIFEPIALLEPQAELTFQVWALAQSAGDQRVRFAVASEEVRVPIQREISTRVYSDKNP